MGRFAAWLRKNSEEQLLAATQEDLARRYLDRGGPVGQAPPPGAFFWQRLFVPVYRRLPWRLRRFVIHRLPGSHRRRWGSRMPPRRGIVVPVARPAPREESRSTHRTHEKGRYAMVEIAGERVRPGEAVVDHEEKVFPDHQAEEGDKAYVFMHTVPFEGSVGLVNMLTCTRLNRKGFDTHLVLYGPGSLMAAATRGFPNVGDEAFPGNLGYNKQLQTFMDEGGHVYACRFSAAALYGMREVDMMEGVKPIHPRDVLDAALTAYREGAVVFNTWTV